MSLVSNPKDGDDVSIRQAIARLGSSKLGPTSTPTFLGVTTTTLTISGLTTNSLIYPVAGLLTSLGVATDGQIPVGDTGGVPVLATISGVTNEIDVTNGAGTITVGIVNPLIVAKGGTGAATLTDHGILLGSGTSAVTPLGVASNGQLPIGSAGADPVLATLTGTAKRVLVTNGAGTITLSGPQDIDTVDSPTFAGLTLSDLTQGSVVFAGASSVLSQDNSNLFWDDTNNRLGIGINTGFDPRTGLTVSGDVDILHTSSEADDHAFEIDADAAGYGDVKAIDINYITGDIALGEDEGIILINIDETAAEVGSDVFGLEVLATEGNAGIYGMKVGAVVGPIHQDSGTFANPAIGTNDTPQTPVANMIDGDSGPTKRTTIFVAVDDYIIIGATAAFQEIEFILTTPTSNPGIKPTFWYSTGGSGFTQFTPVDGTNGFRNTGVIAWDADDLTDHAVNADTGAANTYDIKIIRTKSGTLSPSPILGYAKTAATTEYIWDKNGDVNVKSLVLTTDLAVAHGGTGASTAADARTNLGLVIGTNVQAWDTSLDSIAALTYASDSFIKVTAEDTYAIRTLSEVRTDLGLVIGTNVQAWDASLDSIAALTYASDSFIKVTAEDTYAIRTLAEVKTDLSLNLVENTALSTWAGTTNITTLGTIATGAWAGTTIPINKGGTGQVTAQAAIDALTAVSGATNEHVLTKDTATGNAIFKAAAGGGTPGGNDDEMQYNNGGSFGGCQELHYIDATHQLGLYTDTPNTNVRFQIGAGTTLHASTLALEIIGNTSNLSQIGCISTAVSGAGGGGGMLLYSDDGAAMASGDRLGYFLFGGNTGSVINNSAGVFAYAAENWTHGSAYGTRFQFETVSLGATSRTAKLIINADGNIDIGTVSTNLTTHVQVKGSTAGTSNMSLVSTGASGAGGGTGFYIANDDGAAIGSGHRLGYFIFAGSRSASNMQNAAAITAFTNEAWNDGSAYGTELRLESTAVGSTSRTAKMTIGDGVFINVIKSGATQAAAGAAANEVWKTNGHASLPNNVVIIGV